MNKKKIFILLSIVSLAFLLLMPMMYESRIRKESPELLRLNDFKIVKEGDYHLLTNKVDYIVTKNGVLDTITVRLSRGTLTIQPK